ncbi:MAG: hypothetical protein ACXW4G_12215 [Candidatus Deferrimicrobiaceae bacterium]
MERYLRTPIKEIIGKYPPVGALLEEYRIGCVPCSVGTCLLADIVEIHDLSPEDEGTLMAGIAGIVSPARSLRFRNRGIAGRKRHGNPRTRRR